METLPATTNFNRLKKEEIIWLSTHRCQHRHTYAEHPQCYYKECGGLLNQRTFFLDIETTNLAADFGYILCYSMKEYDGEIIRRSLTPSEIKTFKFDEPLMKQFLKDIEDVDKLITYYGTKFDLQFLRTRALKWGLEFPGWKDILHEDVYYIAKSKLRTHRKRLQTVADLLGIPSKQHKLDPDIWQRCQVGDKKSLDWVQLHCDEDVITLEEVYKRLINFRGTSKTSI